ncbi:MAG: beta-galactosidase trimerization domain-containing protein [Planctomycetota bacterium]
MCRNRVGRVSSVGVAVWVAAVLVWWGCAAGAMELRQDMEKGFYELSDAVVTPHIAWAKLYVGGKTRVLVIAPRWVQRETLELAERMDLDYVTFFAPGSGKFGVDPATARYYELIQGQTLEEKVAEIKEKLQGDYDAIIIGFMEWKGIPTEVKYAILKKVSEGTGLVMSFVLEGDATLEKVLSATATEGVEFVSEGVPFSGVGELAPYASSHGADSQLMKLAIFKKGRVACFRYPLRNGSQNVFITPSSGLDPEPTWLDYEYAMSLAIKTILWSARKEPDVLIREIGFGTEEAIGRAELATRKLAISLESTRGEPRQCVLGVTVRSPENEVEGEQETAVVLSPGPNEIEVALRPLTAGSHFVDVVVREGGKVVNWGSCSFVCTSPVSIAGLSTDKERYAGEENAAVSVSVNKGPTDAAKLVLELWDNFGRKLAVREIELAAGSGAAKAEFPLSDCLSLSNTVKAVLFQDGEAVDTAAAEFGVSQPLPDYTVVLWSMSSSGHVKRLVHRAIYDCGLDGIVCNASWQRAHQPVMGVPFKDNIRVINTVAMFREEWRAQHGGAPRSSSDLVRTPCLTDPEYRQELAAQIEGTLAHTAKYGSLGYSMGDEIYFAFAGEDLCFSPTCMASFRRHLQKEYGGLDGVNREWGTQYGDWEEVVPITLPEAKKTGRYAQWVDHRLHMDSVWADAFRYGGEVCRAKDPTARAGGDTFSGLSTWLACDWWKLSDACELIFSYAGAAQEVAFWKPVTMLTRSFRKEGALTGWCYGGYVLGPGVNQRLPETQRYYPWKILFEGSNGITWYAAYGYANISAGDRAFAPDLTPYPTFEAGLRQMQEIKGGVAKLLLRAKRVHDVGIYYSRASEHVAEFDGPLSTVLGASTHTERYLALLEDLGLSYRYVSYQQVKDGELAGADFKVVLLPYAQALSDEEIERIKEFVSAGGTVVADFRPGVRDGHGRLRESCPLDEVFGIRRTGMETQYELGDVTLDAGEGALAVAGRTRLETNIGAGTATALAHTGETPAALVNRYGKGRAWYLNFGVDRYASSLSDEEKGLGMRRVWEKVESLAGLGRRVEFTSDSPANLRALTRALYADGDAQYLGLLRDVAEVGGPSDAAARNVRFKFDHPGHLYDVRKREYLGLTAGAEVALVPGEAHLFALLPYRVGALALSGVQDRYAPGGRIEFQVALRFEGAPVATHVVRVTLTDPDGATPRHCDRTILMKDGAAAGSMRFALNDKPGTWILSATDVTSGRSDKKEIVLGE